VAGRTWTVAYESTAAFESRSSHLLIWIVTGLGLTTSLVLYAIMGALVRSRERAESAVEATEREIEARRRVEQNQELLILELHHRVKNTLATVQSIASQTLRFSKEPGDFKDAFTSRLIALSQAHNRLALGQWKGSGLADLICAQLQAFGLERASLAGPVVVLGPAEAVAISLAIHELATNAAKYGALSTPEGRVEIVWSAPDAGGQMRLTWKERGGPPVRPPQRRGFGSRLIEHGLAREFGGAADLRFEPDGLRCDLTIRLSATEDAA
jgi:two-component sensor histidine kinase